MTPDNQTLPVSQEAREEQPPLADRSLIPWLADQLEQWPTRVHPDRTCSIGWLHRQAAIELRALARERNAILEEAAKVARDYAAKAVQRGWITAPESAATAARHIAAAIRSKKDQADDLRG